MVRSLWISTMMFTRSITWVSLILPFCDLSNQVTVKLPYKFDNCPGITFVASCVNRDVLRLISTEKNVHKRLLLYLYFVFVFVFDSGEQYCILCCSNNKKQISFSYQYSIVKLWWIITYPGFESDVFLLPEVQCGGDESPGFVDSGGEPILAGQGWILEQVR